MSTTTTFQPNQKSPWMLFNVFNNKKSIYESRNNCNYSLRSFWKLKLWLKKLTSQLSNSQELHFYFSKHLFKILLLFSIFFVVVGVSGSLVILYLHRNSHLRNKKWTNKPVFWKTYNFCTSYHIAISYKLGQIIVLHCQNIIFILCLI